MKRSQLGVAAECREHFEADARLEPLCPSVNLVRTPANSFARNNGVSPLPQGKRAREGKSRVFQASIARGKGEDMRLLFRRCAGLDIHKSPFTSCIRVRPPGQRWSALRNWLYRPAWPSLLKSVPNATAGAYPIASTINHALENPVLRVHLWKHRPGSKRLSKDGRN